jgi:hypothetical protein
VLTCESLRRNVEDLRDATARLSQELIKAADLPPELLAEILLLVLRQKEKIAGAAEEVRQKDAPLFAAANRAGGGAGGAAGGGRGDAAPSGDNGRGRRGKR